MSVDWVLFDVNGTLLDPTTIAQALGGGEKDRQLALAALDEAICLAMTDTMTQGYRLFSDHLRACLKRRVELSGRNKTAVGAAIELTGRLEPYADAASALRALANAGLGLGALTNTATAAAENVLQQAGLRDLFEHVIGTDQVQAFKPDPRVYRHGAAVLKAAPERVFFVAAHGWDVFGAKRYGFRTGWIAAKEGLLAETVPEPDIKADSLREMAASILRWVNAGSQPQIPENG